MARRIQNYPESAEHYDERRVWNIGAVVRPLPPDGFEPKSAVASIQLPVSLDRVNFVIPEPEG